VTGCGTLAAEPSQSRRPVGGTAVSARAAHRQPVMKNHWAATRAARDVWLATEDDPRALVNCAFDYLERGFGPASDAGRVA
jgi:hypothetical protein